MIIGRTIYDSIATALAGEPWIILLYGPRQSGKTTLARSLFLNYAYSNLEFPDVRKYALEDRRGFLSGLKENVLIGHLIPAGTGISYFANISIPGVGYTWLGDTITSVSNLRCLYNQGTTVARNNRWEFRPNHDNPALFVSDSASGLARTTDSMYYNGSAFNFSKPVSADTGRFNHLCVAKDTCLEIALFTRTCTRDTLAFMTGADSLTSAYIVSPFATRGAITIPPYIAGITEGEPLRLIIARPAADTASYDRYSVTKIKQR